MDTTTKWPVKKGDDQNCFFEDTAFAIEQFEANAQRMFTAEATDVEACIVNSSGYRPHRNTSIEELETYLNNEGNRRFGANGVEKNSSWMFSVYQSHSRAPMQLSKGAISLLLSKRRVFPQFTHILSSFKFHADEVFGGTALCNKAYFTDEMDKLSNSIFETAYTLKHIENNGRSRLPWSIRQMGIYQKYDTSIEASDCILIQTSDRVKSRIGEIMKNQAIKELPNHWTNMHELHLGTLNYNWDSYFAYINKCLSHINQEYLFSKVEAHEKQVSFASLQELDTLRTQLGMIYYALELNLDVLSRLSKEASRREKLEGCKSTKRYEQFQINLRTCDMGQSSLKQQAAYTIQEADRLLAHLRDTISLQDSNAMMALTHRTIQEAQSMRTITVIALVYVPASFTASLMSMGYIHVESLSGMMKLGAAPEMWFYLAITLPLIVFTFLVWGVWEWWSRRRVRDRAWRKQKESRDEENVIDV